MTATDAAPQRRPRPKPFVRLVHEVGRRVPGAKPVVQKVLIREAYQLLNRRRRPIEAACLNYGWAPESAGAWVPQDDVAELPDAYGLQLYDRVAGAAPLQGLDVLEVGCGRGGGAAYVARVFGTRSMTGLDFSGRAVSWARRTQRQQGLSFEQGDAEALPFLDASFDALLNVESSHCYPHLDRFLDEARRVLRPGGVLLMADLRPADHLPEFRDLIASRFTLEEEEEITGGVVRALEHDAPRRLRAIDEHVPRLLQPAVRDFFATPGSEVFGHLAAGRLRYVRLRGRVPAP